MMKHRIHILIHFDLMKKPILSSQMAKYMEEIIKSMASETETFSQSIEIQPYDSKDKKNLLAQNLKLPLQFRELVSENTSFISISYTEACNKNICLYGCIMRSHYVTKMISNEQTINILVDDSMWDSIQNRLFECIIELCKNTTISYVAIDNESIAPQSIYFAQLRLFSDQAASINPESKVPGVYWTQYFSTRMLNDETISDIINMSSPELYRIVEGKMECGIWIQTTPSIHDDTKELHMALFKILQKSSYSLNPKIIESYQHTLPWIFEKIPF